MWEVRAPDLVALAVNVVQNGWDMDEALLAQGRNKRDRQLFQGYSREMLERIYSELLRLNQQKTDSD